MDTAADALMGAEYGSAGERCMAISVAVGDETADGIVVALKPRIEALKVGPATDRASEVGAGADLAGQFHHRSLHC